MDHKAYLLERYASLKALDLHKKKKKKKKKVRASDGSSKKNQGGGLNIVDADAQWIPRGSDESEGEEAPAVVDDAEVKRMLKMEEMRQQPFRPAGEDGGGWVDVTPAPKDRRGDVLDLSPPRQAAAGPDLSPARRAAAGRTDSPDLSPPRRAAAGRAGSPDISPPRRASARRHDSPDLSPPRQAAARRTGSPDLPSPRREAARRHDSPDLSPPRRAAARRHDSPDLSPPRRGAAGKAGSSDLSPPRRTKQGSPDLSPPRRARKRHSPSPPQQHKRNRHDLSPPRRRRNDSPALSPPQQRGGLKTGAELKLELTRQKEQEAKRFKGLDAEITGRGAETVYRKDGKKAKIEAAAAPPKSPEKPLEWGKGLAQKREAEAKQQELKKEIDKPFARSKDDPDLDKYLRKRIHWGDPMAHLVNRDEDGLVEDFGRSEAMQESGFLVPQKIPDHSWLKRRLPAAPNRYDIRPGRHWDGIDRSNGFEQSLFKKENEKKAQEGYAYRWASEDM